MLENLEQRSSSFAEMILLLLSDIDNVIGSEKRGQI